MPSKQKNTHIYFLLYSSTGHNRSKKPEKLVQAGFIILRIGAFSTNFSITTPEFLVVLLNLSLPPFLLLVLRDGSPVAGRSLR